MPRYKCKVDVVYPYEFEMSATTKEELINKLQSFDTSNLPEPEFYTEIADIEELPEVAALFTLPVLPDYASDRMKEAFKVMVEEIQLAAVQENSNASLNQETKEVIRKQSDTTKITQQHYDEIINTYSEYKKGLIIGVNSSDKLTKYLNTVLGLNKSRSVYSKIWCGNVDRDSLPKGE